MTDNGIGPARATIPVDLRKGAFETPAYIEAAIACFAFPGLHDLAAAFAPRVGKGKRPDYPPICMLAVLMASTLYGGDATVIRELSCYGAILWKACAEQLEAQADNLLLPDAPPAVWQVETFRASMDAATLERLDEAFRASAVRQAQLMGNLVGGTEPDWAQPDPRNTIYGDGTVLTPYSNVSVYTHPGTGERILFGSRARDESTARIQKVRSDMEVDGKSDQRGVNHVAVQTWTDHGRIVLGTGVALRSETWPALELVEAVQDLAEGAVHTLLWDGIYRDWLVDYMMGRHKIQVINHTVVKSKDNPNDKKEKKKAEEADKKKKKKEQEDRVSAPSLPLSKTSILYRIAEQGLTPDDQLKALTLQEDLRALYEGPDALPVGICIYPRVDGRKFEVVYSQDWPMPSATHVVAGETCEHPLVVDDGALYVVEDEPLGDYQVKVALPMCVSATARQGADGIWSRETRWRIPCEFGDFDHDISWTPNGLRYEAGTPQAAHRPLARGLSDLRPVARPHPQFAPTYGRRNDAESYNEWYKKHLRHHGIAMRLTLEGQRLDFLMGAALNNAITYNRFATAA